MDGEKEVALEKLFGSKTRTKLLGLFFTNSDKSFYVREITRIIDEQINSVRRELMNMDSLGLVKNETFENRVYYSANTRHPFFRPLVEIFSKQAVSSKKDRDVRKSTWSEYVVPVKDVLSTLIVVKRDLITAPNGLDLLVVGDDSEKRLTRWAEVVEKKLGRALNYSIITKEEFVYRQRVKDKFILEVLDSDIAEKIDFANLVAKKG